MARLSSTNRTAAGERYVQEVLLVALEFDTPVYAHSGIGTISYDGNDYLGVGDFGTVTRVKESEGLGPAPFELTLSGLDSSLLAEALSAGSYGDSVTVLCGYRQDDGTLVDDPWVVAKGRLAYPVGVIGDNNTISIVVQHNLNFLDQADGSRFSDEQQRQLYPNDEGFEYVGSKEFEKLTLAGQRVYPPAGGSGWDDPGGRRHPNRR